MYTHKNNLIKSPGLYTISVKNWRKKTLYYVRFTNENVKSSVIFQIKTVFVWARKKNCIVCQVGIVTYVLKQIDRLNLSSLKKSF